MKRFMTVTLLLSLAALLGCSSAYKAKDTATEALLGEQPPLIDRELFFGDPEISGSQISPDGKYISFIKPYKDVRNIWVKRTDEAFDAAWPVTADERPVVGYFWSQDGRFILYVQDKGGNENWHVPACRPRAT
jgi:hypothetical protein